MYSQSEIRWVKDREALLDTIAEHLEFKEQIIDKVTSSMELSIDKFNETLVDKKGLNPKDRESWQAIRKEMSEQLKTREHTDQLNASLTKLSATISKILVSDLRTLSLFFVKQHKLDPSSLPVDLKSELQDIQDESAYNLQSGG